MEENNFYKYAFFTLLIIVLLVIVGGTSYFLGRGSISIPTDEAVSVEKIDGPTQPPTTFSPTPVDIILNPASDEDAIKKAVLERTGIKEEDATIAISKNTGMFASGNIREVGEVGGAYFLAVKENGIWKAVYDGQSTPDCVDIDKYSFPRALVPECLDAQGKVIER